MVGAGTHPGAGVPGVLSSAKVVEHLLAEDFPRLWRRKMNLQSQRPEVVFKANAKTFALAARFLPRRATMPWRVCIFSVVIWTT